MKYNKKMAVDIIIKAAQLSKGQEICELQIPDDIKKQISVESITI